MKDTYYDVLGVPPDATPQRIRIAYLSLARQHHPDVNRDPKANQRMAQINLAYETLSDPEKRFEYDVEVGLREPVAEETREPAEQDWSWLRCEKCGKRDATLRVSISMLAASFLIVSLRRGVGGGLLCSTCRAKDGVWYSLVSLVLGPWGLPWGIFWTIQAIWTNMGGEIQPAGVNGQLLRFVAAALHLEGRHWEAVDALTASLRLQDDADVRSALEEIKAIAERSGSPRVYSPRGLDPALGRLGFFGAFAAAILGVVLVIGAAGESSGDTSGSSFSGFNFSSGSNSSTGSSLTPNMSESRCRSAVNSLILSVELEDIITPLVALNRMEEGERFCRADPQGTVDALCDTPALNDPAVRWQLVWCR